MALCEKMERFCEEYINDYNAMRAALRAGYSSKTARSYGYQLLKNKKVIARICELQEEYIKKHLFDDKNRVIKELWEMYEKAMQAKPVTVWDKELKDYVETGEYQFDDKIAMKCLEFIIRLCAMTAEKENEKAGNVEIFVKVEKDES